MIEEPARADFLLSFSCAEAERALAERWGVIWTDPGKTVWVEISVPVVTLAVSA